MKLTLDSTEPLEDAMRVLGALYDVTLVVSTDKEGGTGSARKPASKASRKSASKPAGNKTAKRTPSGATRARPVRASTTAKTATAPSDQQAARRPVSASSNAEVRTWARQNGLTVRDRGRLPASVVTAYRDAQTT